MLLGPWHVESLQCTLHLAMMAMKTDKSKMKMHSAGAKGAETWVSDVALRRSRRRAALRLRRCDAPGGGWRCDAATLRRSGGRVALRRCDAARGRRRCDAATQRRCDAATLERRCDAVGAATLRRCDAGATLRRCWRCDAAMLQRKSDAATLLALRRCDAGSRCNAVGAATRERRCDAVGAATLPSARVHTAERSLTGLGRIKPSLKIFNECRSLTGLGELTLIEDRQRM